MSEAPNKIWVNPLDDMGDWTTCESDKQENEVEYLLSTPPREHADELVKALEHMLICYEGAPVNAIELGKRVKEYRTLLSQIKEGGQ